VVGASLANFARKAAADMVKQHNAANAKQNNRTEIKEKIKRASSVVALQSC
jgi:hypothetical protein